MSSESKEQVSSSDDQEVTFQKWFSRYEGLKALFARQRRFPERKLYGRRVKGLVVVVLILIGIYIIVGFAPHELTVSLPAKARTNAEVTTRIALIASLSGLAAFVGLFWTAQSYRLSVRGQVTDSFLKAVERLSLDNISQRLGAIYVLERLALDSASDHRAVVDILGAFIRETGSSDREVEDPVAVDVQAAIIVLGTLPARESIPRGDLSGSKLVDADFSRLNFHRANFSDAVLKHCNMKRGRFGEAKFTSCQLDECDFEYSYLSEATFGGAHIRNSTFRAAFLSATLFFGARFEGSAYIKYAKGLGASNIREVMEYNGLNEAAEFGGLFVEHNESSEE